MRLSQTLGRFNSRKDNSEANPDASRFCEEPDTSEELTGRLAPDDFDLIESIRVAESAEEDFEPERYLSGLEQEPV
jgi:hypothetical protein